MDNQIFIVLLASGASVNQLQFIEKLIFLSFFDDQKQTNRQNRDGSSRRYVRTGERADR